MIKVYVAGPLTAPHPIQYLRNMKRMIRASKELLLHGYAPYCPALDYQLFIDLEEDEEITVDKIYAFSMAWLDVSDAVLVLPGWEASKGTNNEIKRARERGIPVLYGKDQLYGHFTAELFKTVNKIN